MPLHEFPRMRVSRHDILAKGFPLQVLKLDLTPFHSVSIRVVLYAYLSKILCLNTSDKL